MERVEIGDSLLILGDGESMFSMQHGWAIALRNLKSEVGC